MKYYEQPNGEEEVLRSRVRRCYDALCDLEPAVEYLHEHSGSFNEDDAVKAANQMPDEFHLVTRSLTDGVDLDGLDYEVGLERAQNRLLTTPLLADTYCTSIEKMHTYAQTIIRNLEYQLDAGHFSPTDEDYQTLRDHAISVLGLTDVICDAIDQGFITDVSIYIDNNR